MKIKPSQALSFVSCLFLLHAAMVQPARADSLNWTGNGANQNWSTGNNWTNATAGTSGTAPGAADAVSFFDTGVLTPVVDGSFAGTISSLRFGSTNSDYIATIAPGATLNITGTNGLRVGTP